MLISLIFSGLSGLVTFIFLIPIILVSLSFHEFGHAFVAKLYGDDTAEKQGRVTLNPLKHIDIKGFLFMLFFGIGWAKPVPITVWKFKKLKQGYLAVSLAGIVCNIILSFIFCLIAFNSNSYFLKEFCKIAATINTNLALFNLLPIFPMDGGRILESLWSGGRNASKWFEKNNLVAIGLAIFSAFYITPFLFENSFAPIIRFFCA